MSIAAIEALVILAAKYGPSAVTDIVALFKIKDATIEDVVKVFEGLKKYDAYGIKDQS